jgi:hypothetical protein
MPNDVFRAVDAVLVLGVDDANAPEGAAANALVTQYDLSNAVGRLRNVTVTVSTVLKAFYEIGRRYPTHLRSGVVRISGTAQRAHVNGALLRLLLGDGAVSPPSAANFVQPSFNIVTTLADPARPGQQTRLTIFSAKFDSWAYTLPSEDFVMEGATFQALRVAFEES